MINVENISFKYKGQKALVFDGFSLHWRRTVFMDCSARTVRVSRHCFICSQDCFVLQRV